MDIKYRYYIALFCITGILLPAVSGAYDQTAGYQSLNRWALNLEGLNHKVPPGRFWQYCQQYAAVSQRQAKRRIQRCQSRIPLSTGGIRKRWMNNWRAHNRWCNTVSSYASGGEIRIRERQLKQCYQHPPRLTRQKCKRNDKFHKAAARGNLRYVRRCLNIGLPVNTREGNGWTALHSAARNGHMPVIKLLLQRGAAINVKDHFGRTPLDQAKAGHRFGAITYLKHKGGI